MTPAARWASLYRGMVRVPHLGFKTALEDLGRCTMAVGTGYQLHKVRQLRSFKYSETEYFLVSHGTKVCCSKTTQSSRICHDNDNDDDTLPQLPPLKGQRSIVERRNWPSYKLPGD